MFSSHLLVLGFGQGRRWRILAFGRLPYNQLIFLATSVLKNYLAKMTSTTEVDIRKLILRESTELQSSP